MSIPQTAGFSREQCWRTIAPPSPARVVAVCDHASNRVPEDIALGVTPDLLDRHIALDIGAAGVVERMARMHAIPAFLADTSRLVIDLHREEDSPGLIPPICDGHPVPGNVDADREYRLARFHRPYHRAMEKWLSEADPALILSIHSFTPAMESDPQAARPWEVGLLYNRDERAARHAMRLFAERGIVVGDNEPYSGRQFNATMNRHAEAHGRPYCAIEIRNDLIADEAGQEEWAGIIAEVAGQVALAV